MWVVRELFRLLWAIVVAVTISSVIAIAIALMHGGDFTHALRVSFLCIAGVMLLLSMAGNRSSSANRRVNQGVDHGATFVMRIPGVPPPTEGPTLTATAVFIGTAIALFALALLL